jgi:hypothetical protein
MRWQTRCMLALVAMGWPAGPALGYLRIHPDNPHYFQETTTGKAVMITGYASLVPNSLDYDEQAGFRAYIQSQRVMYARVWHFTPWSMQYAVWPWAASGTSGGYWGGLGGYRLDMNNWNATAWTRMRDSIGRADNAGVYAEIMLFDRCGMSPGLDTRWGNNPWAATNNINGLEVPDAQPPNEGTPDFYQFASRLNLKYQQERYIRKMIDETVAYNNVIYEIENEHRGDASASFGDHYGQFVKGYIAATYPGAPRLVSYSSVDTDLDQFYTLSSVDIVNRHYGKALSEDPSVVNPYINDRWGYNKPINVDEFANGLADPNVLRQICWTIVTSGGHFHIEDAGSAALPYSVLENIRSFKEMSGWNFIAAAPSDNLIVSGGGYCMAAVGDEYVCYFPSGGSKTVNLAGGTYRSAWWDPRNGGFSGVSTFSHAGGNKSFSTPDANDWVLQVTTRPAVTAVLNAKPANTITVDGATGDWGLAQFTTKALAGNADSGDTAIIGYNGYQSWTCYKGGHWTGGQYPPANAADHAVRVYSRHDPGFLYFLVRVDDSDLRTPNPASGNRNNDCVSFYIDPGNDGGASTMSNSHSDVQLVIDAANQKGVYMTDPNWPAPYPNDYASLVLGGVTSAVSTDSAGWWLEVRIAKTALSPAIPATSGTIGLDFTFRDNDNNNDAAQTTVYSWTDNVNSSGFPSKIPDNWGALALTTGDSTAPGRVTSLTAAGRVGRAALSWVNPDDADFAGTLIRYKTGSPPTGPTDGMLLVDKPNTHGSSDSFTHINVPYGAVYYYAAFAHDAVPNYASAANAAASAPPGDFNTDNDVDMADFGHLQACFTGSGVLPSSGCQDADFDKDGDVDFNDLAQLQACLNGADEAPACE